MQMTSLRRSDRYVRPRQVLITAMSVIKRLNDNKQRNVPVSLTRMVRRRRSLSHTHTGGAQHTPARLIRRGIWEHVLRF